MNILWCSKEVHKQGDKSPFSITQPANTSVLTDMRKGKIRNNSQDELASISGKVYRYQVSELSSRPNGNNDIGIKTIKKNVFLNSDKIKNKNNQLLSWFQNRYILLKPSSIADFLQGHKELISLLNEAYKELRKYFLTEDLKLELVSDAEIAGDQQLFVYISTSLSVTDALKKLDKFDEQWWLDRIDRANGLLNFNLRFV